MRDQRVQRELELERLAIQMRDERAEQEAERNGLSATAGGKALVKRAVGEASQPFREALEAWKAEQAGKRRSPVAYKFLNILPPEVLVFLTARRAINLLARKESKYRDFIKVLANDVLVAAGAHLYEQKDKEGFQNLVRRLNWQPRTYARNRMLEEVFRHEAIELTATDQERLAIGATLLQMLCDSTGLFEVRIHRPEPMRTLKMIVPTEKGTSWALEALEATRMSMPLHLPMVIPPIPWTTLDDGGYLMQDVHRARLVRRHHDYNVALETADLSGVMAAVNAIQETAWQINRPVLDVWRQCIGRGLAGCSSTGTLPVPDRLPREHPEYDARQAARRDAFEANKDNLAKRCTEMQKMRMADILEYEPELYYPHNLDFRGRIYPLAGRGSINPQGDDSGKALLRFAEGKPLGEDGLQWLYIHAQNCWGNDKVSLQERIDATVANYEMYVSYALDPMANTGWMEADKPFCFLAVCFELLRHSFWVCGGNSDETFVSYLPIALDGSCSGLQHFAGIMLDESIARAVNVVPGESDTPSDIYSKVAEGVASSLPEDNYWKGLVSRDLVKQPVMTLTYGVTLTGMRNQIREKCKKLVRKGKVEYTEGTTAENCQYLADCIHASIGTVASAAYDAMDWLAEAAKVKAKTVKTLEGALSWVTPIGLPVLQEYYDYDTRQYHVIVDGRELRFTQRMGPAQVRASKQKQGAAPNFVHSMDASHLMLTVKACKEHGINSFAMIHDSFGTHAADTGVLFEVLRDEFAKMYERDVLLELWESMPPEVKEVLRKPPKRGSLDLALVRDSEFFFA